MKGRVKSTRPFDVHRATIDDLDALLPLVAGYRAFYKRDADPRRERAFMAAHLEHGTSTVFIARTDGRAAGFVQLYPTHSTTRLGPALILEDLFVASDARRLGIASGLLAAALAYAREIGAMQMFLETAMDNVAAQALYERHGWTREREFYKYNAPLR